MAASSESQLKRSNSVKKRINEFEQLCKNGKNSNSFSKSDYRRQSFIDTAAREGLLDSTKDHHRAKPKVTKSASCVDLSSSRPSRRRKAITHPLQIGQSTNIEDMKTHNLSNSITWHIRDLVKASKDQSKEVAIPDSFDETERAQVSACRPENRLRNVLLILPYKNFDTMWNWLKHCELEKSTIENIFKMFDDLHDMSINKDLMCFACRLSKYVPIVVLGDCLFSFKVLSSNLYSKLIHADDEDNSSVTQTELWDMLAKECARHSKPKDVALATKNALSDVLESAKEIEKKSIDGLLNDLSSFKDTPGEIYICHCKQKPHQIPNVKRLPFAKLNRKKNPNLTNHVVQPVTETSSSDVSPASSSSGGESPVKDLPFISIPQCQDKIDSKPFVQNDKGKPVEVTNITRHRFESSYQRKVHNTASPRPFDGNDKEATEKTNTTSSDSSTNEEVRKRTESKKVLQRNAFRMSLRENRHCQHTTYAHNVYINNGSHVLYQTKTPLTTSSSDS